MQASGLRGVPAPLCLGGSRTFPRQRLLSRFMGPRLAIDGNETCGRGGLCHRGLPPDSAADRVTGF
jgi:hypothetical protein